MKVEITDELLGELERKASAATQDEWVRGEWRRGELVTDDNTPGAISTRASKESVVSGCGCCGSPDAKSEDAEHIAASSPPVILAMIEHIRYLERALAAPCVKC